MAEKITLADLRIFAAVVRLGGMKAAAEALNTVQSNVTARIRHLEEQLGTPLFDRHPRGVSPTAAGRRLEPYARRLTDLLDEAVAATRDDGTPKGTLRIGALESTAALRLTPGLGAFTARYPAVDVILKTGTSAEVVDLVLQREVEGGFVCAPLLHPDLGTVAMFREELAVLGAPGTRSMADAMARGRDRILVLRAGCSYRRRFEEILTRRGTAGWRTSEFGTLDAILDCVGAGLGTTLLPRSLAAERLQRGLLAAHPLPVEEAMAETLFIHRRDSHGSSALAAFLDLVRDNVAAASAAGHIAAA